MCSLRAVHSTAPVTIFQLQSTQPEPSSDFKSKAAYIQSKCVVRWRQLEWVLPKKKDKWSFSTRFFTRVLLFIYIVNILTRNVDIKWERFPQYYKPKQHNNSTKLKSFNLTEKNSSTFYWPDKALALLLLVIQRLKKKKSIVEVDS